MWTRHSLNPPFSVISAIWFPLHQLSGQRLTSCVQLTTRTSLLRDNSSGWYPQDMNKSSGYSNHNERETTMIYRCELWAIAVWICLTCKIVQTGLGSSEQREVLVSFLLPRWIGMSRVNNWEPIWGYKTLLCGCRNQRHPPPLPLFFTLFLYIGCLCNTSLRPWTNLLINSYWV